MRISNIRDVERGRENAQTLKKAENAHYWRQRLIFKS
jgi:hypothetical protein